MLHTAIVDPQCLKKGMNDLELIEFVNTLFFNVSKLWEPTKAKIVTTNRGYFNHVDQWTYFNGWSLEYKSGLFTRDQIVEVFDERSHPLTPDACVTLYHPYYEKIVRNVCNQFSINFNKSIRVTLPSEEESYITNTSPANIFTR